MDVPQAITENPAKRGRPIGVRDSVPRMNKRVLARRIERLQSLGVLPNTAAKVIAALGDADYMLEIIGRLEANGEYGKLWDALQFLLQMRDGRPVQAVNLTALSLKVSPEQILAAKQVVRELITPRLLPSADRSVGHNGAAGQGVEKDGE